MEKFKTIIRVLVLKNDIKTNDQQIFKVEIYTPKGFEYIDANFTDV